MYKIDIGKEVLVKTRDGIVKCVIVQKADFYMDEIMWWTERIAPDGTRQVEIFSDSDIKFWNDPHWGKSTRCECGSDSVGHPGHAYYCDFFTE